MFTGINEIVEVIRDNILTLIIGTLLGTEVTRYLYKPQVIIQFRDIMPLYSDEGFFISIGIANRGRTVANNCIGNITIDNSLENLLNPEKYSLDECEKSLPEYHFENIKMDFPRHQLITPAKKREIKNVTICWSKLGNPAEININPGSSNKLDLCRIQKYQNKDKTEKFWYVIFPCEQGWRKVRCRIKLKPNEVLTGKLFVCPDSVFPTVRMFRIEYSDIEIAPKFILKELTLLKRVYYFFNRSKLYFD